jgi:PKHD-type hydroxylase
MNDNIWQFYCGVLDEDTVNQIVTECEYYNPVSANLGFDGDSPNEGHRSSEVRWINKRDPNSKFIADLLWYYGQEANRYSYGFHVDYIDEIQYTTYYGDTNDHYGWHHDTFWGNRSAYDRKISIVIQLSDSEDYEGGNFELDEQYGHPDKEELRKKGSIIIFPSFIRHRVTPVTSGVRKSLVTWIQGPKFR